MKLRAWQAEALDALTAYHARERERGKGAIVQAVMGAGKSILMSQFIRSLSDSDRIVVVAPTVDLVRQLSRTLRKYCGKSVGQFYGLKKQPSRQVVVACLASLPTLAEVIGSCDVLIFDEAHRSETEGALASVEALSPSTLLGFTATPYRSLPGERLSLYKDVLYSYSFSDALEDGVLVPYCVESWTDADARQYGNDLDDVCLEMVKRALPLGPGIVNAPDTADADRFAQRLRDNGILAVSVHGKISSKSRINRLAAIESGAIQVLVHVNVLAEGVDIPSLRWIVLRRGSTTKIRFPQEIGRILRAHPGKTHAVVYDPHALSVENALQAEADLWKPRRAVCAASSESDTASVRRYVKRRGFTKVYETELDVKSIIDKMIAEKIGTVVLPDADCLDARHVLMIRCAPDSWGSVYASGQPRAAKILYARKSTKRLMGASCYRDDSELNDIRKYVGYSNIVECESWFVKSLDPRGLVQLIKESDYRLDVLVFKSEAGADARLLELTHALGLGVRFAERMPREVEVTPLDDVTAWAHKVSTAFTMSGAAAHSKSLPAYIRDRPATEKQISYFRTLAHRVKRWNPQPPDSALPHMRRAYKRIMRGYGSLGFVADCITVFRACEDSGGWPDSVLLREVT